MKKLAPGSGLFVVGLLLIGTGAWAAPAGAGSRPTAPGLNFLFDKDAFGAPLAPAAEPARSGLLSRLSVRLYGGFSYAAAADVNTGAQGFMGYLQLLDAYGGGTFSGAYRPLHGGFDAGIDLVYEITPKIGIGVGAGFIRQSQSSLATFTSVAGTGDVMTEAVLSAVPIRLGAFFRTPLAAKFDLTAELGGAYYAGLDFDLADHLRYDASNWVETLFSGGGAGASRFGFHGSLGFEYRLSPRTGLFIQVAGRAAKLGNFSTASEIFNDGAGNSKTTDGKFYLRRETLIDWSYTDLVVRATPPISDADTVYREPKFDLTGFSVQIGVRLRL
ncbi:MAG TPA: hypothetical protein VLJ16_12960 [Acidobacteriota bacterium]|nr:hypothetical protein [Acidobacteriota bacterium]